MKTHRGKHLVSFFVLILLTFLASGSSKDNHIDKKGESGNQASKLTVPSNPKPPDGLMDLSQNVAIDFKVDLRDDKKVSINGITNLPQDTELIVTIESKSSGRYFAQDRTTVHGYRFVTNLFSQENRPLPDGVYTVRIMMPIPSVQPDSVKKIIGPNGENLNGKLVRREKGHKGVTVEMNGEFFIGESQTVAAKAEKQGGKALKQEADIIYKELLQYLKLGKQMEDIRQSHDLSKIRLCGEKMRQYQKIADSLRDRSENLPNNGNYYMSLKIAAISLNLCVSCSRTLAMDNCRMVEEQLNDARKGIKK